MNEIYELIEQWIKQKQIPSAVIQINLDGQVIGKRAFGQATLDTIYDVASLTKVTATLPSLLLLEQMGLLSLDDKIAHYIPQFLHEEVTLKQCLLHRTGLPGSLKYPQDRYSKDDVWQEILALPLISKPGSETRYSDIGMVLVGKVIEKVTTQSLATFSKQNIFDPLNLLSTQFLPILSNKAAIAATEWDVQTQSYLQGVVHDEVSYRLQGISGSAGLFSTVSDLGEYAQMWLFPERYSLLTTSVIDKCTNEPIMSRGLGWQVQDFSGPPLACGVSWPKGSFGHTGFTGTSIWIDPKTKLSVVFLSNAVHYGRQTNMMQLRNQLHHLVYTYVLENH